MLLLLSLIYTNLIKIQREKETHKELNKFISHYTKILCHENLTILIEKYIIWFNVPIKN